MLLRNARLNSSGPGPEVRDDVVVGLELGLEGVVEFASDTVVHRRVQALSTAPQVGLVVSLQIFLSYHLI